MEKIKRNVLLNPGPATTTDTVKMAQVVPDICPREKEFAGLMKGLRSDLLKVVHAPEDQYTSVLFCGSGTINIDVCINSLVPEGKKVLVVNNGAYNARAVEVCQMLQARLFPHPLNRPYRDPHHFPVGNTALDTTSDKCVLASLSVIAADSGDVSDLYIMMNHLLSGHVTAFSEELQTPRFSM